MVQLGPGIPKELQSTVEQSLIATLPETAKRNPEEAAAIAKSLAVTSKNPTTQATAQQLVNKLLKATPEHPVVLPVTTAPYTVETGAQTRKLVYIIGGSALGLGLLYALLK